MGRRIPVGMDMLEDDLLVAVLDLCKAQQLRTAHFRPALTAKGRWITPVQGDGKGWPDLFILGPFGALFRELKRTTGKVSPEQQVWMDALRAAGYDVGVWQPIDLISGRIGNELRAIRRRPRIAAPAAR